VSALGSHCSSPPSRPAGALRHGHQGGRQAHAPALAAARITRRTPNPKHGVIVRDRRGEPTGLLKGDAMALADKVLLETDPGKRDLLIKEAFEIEAKDFGYIPLHQQALAWGVSKKVKLTQRADNQVLLYWATKQEE